MSNTQRRRDQRQDKDREKDDVTEAGIESFPASDPPSYNTPGRGKSDTGKKEDKPKDEDRRPRDSRR